MVETGEEEKTPDKKGLRLGERVAAGVFGALCLLEPAP